MSPPQDVSGVEKEYREINKTADWQIIYQKIRAESSNHNFTQLESIKPQNKALNRYRDVSPYDHSRIVLHKGNTDYINANLVKLNKAKRQYILTQGPLTTTVNHFWLMVWEQNSKAVLMLNKLFEKKQEKCTQYWPSKIGKDHAMKMEDVGLTLEYTANEDHSHYLIRTLLLSDMDSGKSREILQFHYTTWPDFGVPSSPTAFLQFLKKVRETGVLEQDVGPAVVHCSAGIGRSGTFCLVDSCLILIENFGEDNVNVKEVLLELRQYRMGLIQTPEQLRFSYEAIIEGIKKLHACKDEEVNQAINILEKFNAAFVEKSHLPVHVPQATIVVASRLPKCFLFEKNCPSDPIINNNVEEGSNSEDEEESPPPLPERTDSLKRNGPSIDRPLPKIPKSTSLDFPYEDSDSEKEPICPAGPLPTAPNENDEEDASSISEAISEDESEPERSPSPASDKSDCSPVADAVPDGGEPLIASNISPSELRQRVRIEKQEKLATQIRDMKRRRQQHERWTHFKRSLYKPLIVSGALVLTGGLIAYLYLKA